MKKYKQVPLTIYPEAESMLEKAMKITGNLQASVLREALTMGLKQILSQHQSPSPNQQPLEDIRRQLNMLADIYERQGLLTKTEADQWRGEG